MDHLSLFSQVKRRLPLGGIVFLVYLVAWFSSNSVRPYWTDEIFSIWTSGGGSLTFWESLGQISAGRDGMMPAFYFLSTAWEGVLSFFGILGGDGIRTKSEIWLRIPSLVWTLVGFGSLFVFLKHRYGGAGAGVGLAIGMLCTLAPGTEMQWVRAYAPMVAMVAILIVFVGMRDFPRRMSLVYLSFVGLTLFHPYGFLYGSGVILTAGAVDISHGRIRRGVVTLGSAILPFIIILVNFGRLVKVKNLGGEGGMWPTPGFDSLIFSLAPFSSPIVAIFAIMLCGVVFVLGDHANCKAVEAVGGRGGKDSDYLFEWVALSLVATPGAIWILSQWDSFFVIRYFAPSVILIVVLSSWITGRILGRETGWISAVAVVVVCFSYASRGVVWGDERVRKEAFNNELKGRGDERFLINSGGDNFPLIIEDLDIFLPRIFYNPSGRYFFPARSLSVDEANFRDKALAQNLVLAHAESYSETGGKVGIDPEAVLDKKRLEELTEESSRIFMITNKAKGTGGFVEEHLGDKGWKKATLIPGYLVAWEKPQVEQDSPGAINLWYGTSPQ